MSEFYNILRNDSKDRADRYRSCSVLKDRETGDTILATREILDIPQRYSDKYHRVKINESTRLDLIANKYYSNSLLWWVIAQANDIYDPFVTIAPGTLLRIPAIESLYGNEGILL